MIFFFPNKIQYHSGYIYFIVILFIISLTSVLFFYIVVSLKYFFFYKLTNNTIYLDSIVYYLFQKVEDDKDVLEDSMTTEAGLPSSLLSINEDFSSEYYKLPDGFFYHFTSPYDFKYLWTGSYSKYIFLM